MKWRPIVAAGLICAAAAGIALWVIHARLVGHWFQVHTGTIDEPGQYYAFWSGFGSDLTEFGVIGAIATAAYQLFRKYNCHQPGCWRVGTHQAAGGEFSLCYRHHPDFQGKKPSAELIKRLHQEHLERQAAIHGKLNELHQRLVATPAAANGVSEPVAPTAQGATSGGPQAGSGTLDGPPVQRGT